MQTPSVAPALVAGSLPEAFKASGGALTGSEIAELLRLRMDQPISVLARWIVSRQVVTFAWQSNLLLPLFQFDFARSAVRDGLRQVLVELSTRNDEPQIALWFSQPNARLAGLKPADCLSTDAGAVLAAARAARADQVVAGA